MSLRITVVLCAAAAAAIACGGGPASPSGGATALRITGDSILTLEDGQSVELRIEESGRSQDPAQYQWSTTDPSVATVSGTGVVRAAHGYGQAIITARAATGATADVRVWVQYPESRPTSFRVTFVFAPDVHPLWREAYAYAGERWARVIRTELPAFDLTNHSPCKFPAGIPPITGVETGVRVVVLNSPNSNSGGPCTRRGLPRPTTVLGVVEASHGASIGLDSGRSGHLRTTAVHEMGHVLGLAGIIGINGEPYPWYDQRTSRYTGALALDGYRRVFGISVPYLDARAGDWHWTFKGELMTSPPSGPLTSISVGALMDIGYPAAWYGADR